MRYSVVIAAALALAACHRSAEQQPSANESTTAAAPEAGPVKGVDRSHKGKLAPAATFNDPDGAPMGLGNFTGKPTLVNLWATWCAPCVKELPTLDRLAAAHNGDLNVVAVSQDDGPHASVVAFLQANKITNLDPFQDPTMALSGALGPDTVLPTTILYDANGKEVWRYVGDLDWTSAEASKLLAEGGVQPRG
ncbi:MAG: TlpA family protein disulfide reductase [Myxococcales bacterium]|jgi:thiol-disulfide isomerase/thioredoxin|nr:TlpA disulfide reductase family protein [Sphingomicrobium sp.]